MNKELCRMLHKLDELEDAFDREHRSCMVPDCGGDAIKSHSQQRNGALAAIAEDGHVIAIKRKVIAPLFKATPNAKPKSNLTRVGVRRASTFSGFCYRHDTEIFKSIDTQRLGEDKTQQALALHRRALAFEIRNKEKMCYMFETAYKLSKYPDARYEAYLCDLSQLLVADKKFAWQPLWENNPISNLNYEWVTLDKSIGVSLTSCINPLSDLSLDAYLESIKDYDGAYSRSRPFFSLSILPEEFQTHIVMVWNKFNDSNVEKYRSLLCNPSGVGKFLDICVFDRSEDFCLKPSLWTSLPVGTQSAVREKVSNIRYDDYTTPLTIFHDMLTT